jgi:hypothetical protein
LSKNSSFEELDSAGAVVNTGKGYAVDRGNQHRIGSTASSFKVKPEPRPR